MKTELTKKQAEEKIENFFSDIKNKNSEQIRKIKRLTMHYKIKLKEKRKLFCQKCYSNKLRVLKIKNKVKSVECLDCRKVMRWRIKSNKKSNSSKHQKINNESKFFELAYFFNHIYLS